MFADILIYTTNHLYAILENGYMVKITGNFPNSTFVSQASQALKETFLCKLSRSRNPDKLFSFFYAEERSREGSFQKIKSYRIEMVRQM